MWCINFNLIYFVKVMEITQTPVVTELPPIVTSQGILEPSIMDQKKLETFVIELSKFINNLINKFQEEEELAITTEINKQLAILAETNEYVLENIRKNVKKNFSKIMKAKITPFNYNNTIYNIKFINRGVYGSAVEISKNGVSYIAKVQYCNNEFDLEYKYTSLANKYTQLGVPHLPLFYGSYIPGNRTFESKCIFFTKMAKGSVVDLIEQTITKKVKDRETIFKSIVRQSLVSLYVFHNLMDKYNCDTHFGNFLYFDTPNKCESIKFDDGYVDIKNQGFNIVTYDYGLLSDTPYLYGHSSAKTYFMCSKIGSIHRVLNQLVDGFSDDKTWRSESVYLKKVWAEFIKLTTINKKTIPNLLTTLFNSNKKNGLPNMALPPKLSEMENNFNKIIFDLLKVSNKTFITKPNGCVQYDLTTSYLEGLITS